METISYQTARKLALAAQGLLRKNPFGKGKKGVSQLIEHLGYVQIDSISVVSRAHHHIIWTRVENYQPEMLDILQTPKREIFEYWSHAAAYLPITDFRFSLPRMEYLRNGGIHWYQSDKKVMQFVLDRITAEGPLRAKDFDAPKDRKPGTWWDWKPAKKALEQLFMEGQLMVVKRQGFQKIYDLAERALPAGINLTMPTSGEIAEHLIRRAIRANSFVREGEITYLRKGVRKNVKTALDQLQEAGEIIKFMIKGIPGDIYYSFPEIMNQSAKRIGKKLVYIISPFDNAIIQRKRALKIFGYDYQLECYVPKPKRKYGYFCLPVLWGNEFVGRMDAKADRPKQNLIIQNLVMEPLFKHFDAFIPGFKTALWEFAEFNGCGSVEVKKTAPDFLKDMVKNK